MKNDYKRFWITQSGDKIAYVEMTDNHLINAHNMIERRVCNFINRCASRNEEQDLPEDVEQKIEGLETEMEKRGLLETKGDDDETLEKYDKKRTFEFA